MKMTLKLELILLLAFVCLSVAAALWGIDFGYHWDEKQNPKQHSAGVHR